MSPSPSPVSPVDAAVWWRRLCPVTDQVLLCGDLPADERRAVEQLLDWLDGGVTHILDVRGEHSDESFVAELAPHLTYLWLGVDDHGGNQDHDWFETGVALALDALADPTARVVVHCHMGINRGPSMAFALLLAQGRDPVEALDAIRTSRPIAAVLYAEDAVSWWHARKGSPAGVAAFDRARVQQWFVDNRVDPRTAIRRIREVEW